MAVTQADVEQVPIGNLRVPRAAFGAVWAEAERRSAQSSGTGADWYAGGVQATCMWLAGAIHAPPNGPPAPAAAPATRRRAGAYEELIEAELQAAELLPLRHPALVSQRPGWCDGIVATLRWAWRHDGPPPFELAEAPDPGEV